MLKKSITYTDFNGEKRTEDYYFNLSRAELTEMQMSVNGGMTEYLQQIVNSQDNKEIFAIFKDIIFKAIGEKSVDGKRFVKNSEIRESFEQSEAYSELLIELMSDATKASDFINALIPDQIQEEVRKEQNQEAPKLEVVNNESKETEKTDD